jgi:hypothetical protein
VSGSWTIPQVSCILGTYRNQDVFIANWVGLDGFNDGTVEQLGTAVQCYEDVEYYYDWYELYPANTVEEGTTQCINYNTECPTPGDQITASVVSTPGRGANSGNNVYTLSLTDSTHRDESFSTTQTCGSTTCVNSSAEWVVERPATAIGSLIQILPQADYSQTSFQNGTVGVGNKTYTIDQYPGTVYDMPMMDDTASYILSCPGQNSPPGQLLLLPNACPLTTARNGSFSDTWDASY